MFDIHKIKPIHGWREFVGEVGIIVLGVLIALGAEQALTAMHWRHEVETGRKTVQDELQDLVFSALEREAESACIGRRLNELSSVIESASGTGILPPLGDIGSPTRRLWQLQTWNTLISSQTATHFSKREAIDLNKIEAAERDVDPLNANELDRWTTLWTMVGPGRHLADGEESQLREALSHANADAKLLRVLADELLRQTLRSGVLQNNHGDDVDPDILPDIKEDVAKMAICRPIGPVPAHYGGSPFNINLQAPMSSNHY